MIMKRYQVILNGQIIKDYERVSSANKMIGKVVNQAWFSDDADLVEIYDSETGEYIYTNEK